MKTPLEILTEYNIYPTFASARRAIAMKHVKFDGVLIESPSDRVEIPKVIHLGKKEIIL